MMVRVDTTRPVTHQVHDTLASLIVPVDRLRHFPGNPRRGDLAVIAESLRTNGQYRPVVVNSGSLTGRPDEVLAGNQTLAAARQLGWSHVAATFVDVNAERAARIVAVDNRASDLAGYDDAELAALLSGLPDLSGTGYDQAALDELLAGVAEPEFEPVDDGTRLDQRNPVECPSCGYRWRVGPGGAVESL